MIGKHKILVISSCRGFVTGASEPKRTLLLPTFLIRFRIPYGIEHEVSNKIFLYLFKLNDKSTANSIAKAACPTIILRLGYFDASFEISLLLIPLKTANFGVKWINRGKS